jgi:hypothetical protein
MKNCTKQEYKIIKYRPKLHTNYLIITRADKESTVVIMPLSEYINKIHEFIQENKIKNIFEFSVKMLFSSPTLVLMTETNSFVNQCN